LYKPTTPFECGSDFPTRTGACLKSGITSSSQCTAPNYWVYRAKTKSQCLGNGTECILPNGFQNTMNQTQCADCDGLADSIYRWTDVTYLLT
jgi:hypothetical protein